MAFALSHTISDPDKGQLKRRSAINRRLRPALRGHCVRPADPQGVVPLQGQGGLAAGEAAAP